MRNIWLILVFVLGEVYSLEVQCPVCNGTAAGYAFVESFCQENNAEMKGRCCISQQNSTKIIGLDFRNCDVTNLNVTNITSYKDVEIVDLQYNDLNKVTKQEFIGLLNLEYLYLSLQLGCPGGDRAWSSAAKNSTYNVTECLTQLNPCSYLNVSCTENGMCLHTGPGSAKCVCKPNHHGYKCLQQGEFPITMFSLSLIFPTLFLTVAFWFTQRRYVLTEEKRE